MKDKRRGSRLGIALVVTVVPLTITAQGSAYPRPSRTDRVSVGPSGRQANGDTQHGSIDDAGRLVVLDSQATNLISQTNGSDKPQPLNAQFSRVYVHDRTTGRNELISVPYNGGTPASQLTDILLDGSSGGGVISGNGRFVLYGSSATNVVAEDDDNGDVGDLYVYDRESHTSERVSISSSGRQQDQEGSGFSDINRSGRFVAWGTTASNLVRYDHNGGEACGPGPIPTVALLTSACTYGNDIFVHDRSTDRTERVSVSSKGVEPNGDSFDPSLSGNGRYVVFESDASNLVPTDTNDQMDVFVFDRKKDTIELVSKATDGRLGDRASSLFERSMSANGRKVTFQSDASNLVPNDSGSCSMLWNCTDIFVRDLKTDRTTRVSVTSWGSELGLYAMAGSISGNGRRIAFLTNSYDDIDMRTDPGGSSTKSILVHDRLTNTTDVAVSGDERYLDCCLFLFPTLNRSGRVTLFPSYSDDLVDHDTNKAYDMFIHDRGPELGVSGLDETGKPPNDEPEGICITEDLCIPPLASMSFNDKAADTTFADQGADLIEARLTYRPHLGDLFATLELEHMPKVIPGLSPIFYSLRFTVEDNTYEVRATSLLGGTFGLFDCTDSRPVCAKVADLRGGYGTTGMRVVFSLPLKEIGLEGGGALSEASAFTSIGSNVTGPASVLDRIRLN